MTTPQSFPEPLEDATPMPLAALAVEGDGPDDVVKLERLTSYVELEDGTSWDVLIVNQDFVAWDLTRAKKKWPAADDAPFLLNNFLTWNASKRAGHPVGTVEAFVATAPVVHVTRAEPARPTR